MLKLPCHEWLIICLLIATLMMLAFVTMVWKKEELPQTTISHALNAQMIQVSIKGAVSQPGSYELKKGALVQDLLDLAFILPEANLARIKPEAKLRNGQVVNVPVQEWITVHLEGAVMNPGALRIKLGTTLKDLSETVVYLPGADVEKMQKKRRLKDQEVIQVPVKKEKKPLKKEHLSKGNVVS